MSESVFLLLLTILMPVCTARVINKGAEFDKDGLAKVEMTVRPAADCFGRCTGLVRYQIVYSDGKTQHTSRGLVDWFSKAGEDAMVKDRLYESSCRGGSCTVQGVEIVDVDCLTDRK